MKNIMAVMSLLFATAALADKKEEMPAYALPMVQNWLHQCSEAVDVCVFREQWVAPAKKMPKGMLLKFGTITVVHKGTVKVGERIVMAYLFEYPAKDVEREARLRPDRVSMVDGELHVVIFDKKDTKFINGYWDVGDITSKFSHDDDFHRAFLIEKKRDPHLKGIPN